MGLVLVIACLTEHWPPCKVAICTSLTHALIVQSCQICSTSHCSRLSNPSTVPMSGFSLVRLYNCRWEWLTNIYDVWCQANVIRTLREYNRCYANGKPKSIDWSRETLFFLLAPCLPLRKILRRLPCTKILESAALSSRFELPFSYFHADYFFPNPTCNINVRCLGLAIPTYKSPLGTSSFSFWALSLIYFNSA